MLVVQKIFFSRNFFSSETIFNFFINWKHWAAILGPDPNWAKILDTDPNSMCSIWIHHTAEGTLPGGRMFISLI